MSDVHYSRSPAFFIGLAFLAFQLWIVINPQQALFERPIHLSFALVLLFLYRPLTNQYLPLWMCRSIDLICILGALGVSLYYVLAFDRLTTRMENVSPVLTVDMVVGVGLVLLLLEGARRAVGWVLVAVLGTLLPMHFLGRCYLDGYHFGGFRWMRPSKSLR